MQADTSSIIDGESEDDFDWEEVAVPLVEQENVISILPEQPVPSGSSTPAPNIEITIRAKPKPDESAKCVNNPSFCSYSSDVSSFF